MSSFTHALVVEDLENGNWRVWAPFAYEVGTLGSGRFVLVPAGFTTDFASIPRGLWNLFPPNGRGYDRAAVVHDYLYRGGHISQVIGNYEYHVDPNRGQADAILKEAMEASQVGWWTRQIVYAGVRVGGTAAWNKGHDVSKK